MIYSSHWLVVCQNSIWTTKNGFGFSSPLFLCCCYKLLFLAFTFIARQLEKLYESCLVFSSASSFHFYLIMNVSEYMYEQHLLSTFYAQRSSCYTNEPVCQFVCRMDRFESNVFASILVFQPFLIRFFFHILHS